MMEGNKEEAMKCVRIGKDALEAGNTARAIKFLSKAQGLDPSLPIQPLLDSAAASAAEASGASPQDPSPSNSAAAKEGAHKRYGGGDKGKAKAEAAATDGDDSSSGGFTEEQVEIVRQVITHKRDYYKILGLDKASCTVEEVRKAYRKLSLKVHPDKNKAPGAEDAFKAVSKAFQCLSDDESRKRYDLVGSEIEDTSHRHSRSNMRRSYNDEEEFDPEEVFRNFFFGGMAPAPGAQFRTFHFRTGGMGGGARAHASAANSSSSSPIRMLIQLLPILILVLFNFLPSSDPVYSLSQTYQYSHKLTTQRGITYYVKSPKFEEQYPYHSSERLAMEQRIEREYLGILSQNCRLELQRKQWGFSYATPHCDMLNKFDAAA